VRSTHCLLRIPTPYVYPPYLASLWSALQNSTGISGATALYGGLYYFLLIYLLRLFILGNSVGGQGWLRACLLAVIGADIFVCGNVAVIVHATLALCVLFFWEYPIIIAIAIILAAAIKPIYLVYISIFLFHPMKFIKKIFYAGFSTFFGLFSFLLFMKERPLLYNNDMSLIKYYALVNDRGTGFLNIVSFFGIKSFSFSMIFLYVLFVSMLIGFSMYICRSSNAKIEQRLWIGITASIVSDPRLMFYDFLTIAPGIVCIVSLSKNLGQNVSRPITIYIVVLCVICSLLNSRGGQYGLYLFVPASFIMIVGLGIGFMVRDIRSRYSGRIDELVF